MKKDSQQIIDEALKNNVITESEIKLLCKRMNAGEGMDVSGIWNNCVDLTADQNKKGIDFLMNQWKTPKGIQRKNSPFGYREEAVLENFTGFELAGFYDISKWGGRSYLIPLYNCVGKNGDAFQYYYDGEVQIVG